MDELSLFMTKMETGSLLTFTVIKVSKVINYRPTAYLANQLPGYLNPNSEDKNVTELIR